MGIQNLKNDANLHCPDAGVVVGLQQGVDVAEWGKDYLGQHGSCQCHY